MSEVESTETTHIEVVAPQEATAPAETPEASAPVEPAPVEAAPVQAAPVPVVVAEVAAPVAVVAAPVPVAAPAPAAAVPSPAAAPVPAPAVASPALATPVASSVPGRLSLTSKFGDSIAPSSSPRGRFASDALKPQSGDSKEQWVLIQKKTFTKWTNNHLQKKGFPLITDAEVDWDTGIKLMQVISALYGAPIPKHNPNPKFRPHKLDNIVLALRMVEESKIKTNFLKSTHLIDHDLKMILGMMWAIILDYAIKGISEDDLTAKEGLLLWARKKTSGYRDIDPPGIHNFTRDWVNGLAFCALIHKHFPALIDYNSLDKSNGASNLELAFSVAEKLGIPRLIDVEDVLVDKPDERSIMTQVAEYFHRFAQQDAKNQAARRAAKFLQFTKTIQDLKNQYESSARQLLAWISGSQHKFDTATHFGETVEEAHTVNDELRKFVLTDKPPRSAAKLDLEALYAQIQTELKVNNRPGYKEPSDVSPDAISEAFNQLWISENAYATKSRNNRFRFIKKEEIKLDAGKLQEFVDSFNHFDHDKSGKLDKTEFKAAASAVSVSFKNDAAFDAEFAKISEGKPTMDLQQYIRYLTELNEDKDSAEQIKASFKALSNDKDFITTDQLFIEPLSKSDAEFLSTLMPKHSSGHGLDYALFVDQSYLH